MPLPPASGYCALLGMEVTHRSRLGCLTGEAAKDVPSHLKPTPQRRGACCCFSVTQPPAPVPSRVTVPAILGQHGGHRGSGVQLPLSAYHPSPGVPPHPDLREPKKRGRAGRWLRRQTNLRGGVVSSGTRPPAPRANVNLSFSKKLEARPGHLLPALGAVAPTLESRGVVKARGTWVGVGTEKGASSAETRRTRGLGKVWVFSQRGFEGGGRGVESISSLHAPRAALTAGVAEAWPVCTQSLQSQNAPSRF